MTIHLGNTHSQPRTRTSCFIARQNGRRPQVKPLEYDPLEKLLPFKRRLADQRKYRLVYKIDNSHTGVVETIVLPCRVTKDKKHRLRQIWLGRGYRRHEGDGIKVWQTFQVHIDQDWIDCAMPFDL